MSDTYTTTDYVLAVTTGEAQRYDEPGVSRLVAAWEGSEGCRVRCSDAERGTVVAVRARDKMLLVDVVTGKYWYPMRTTTLEEGQQ